MTTTAPPARLVPSPAPASARWGVPFIAATAVAARLPGLAHAPRPDEAGFLLVGREWHAGGTSLYGNYWVDRPPLLITIFRLGSRLGGVVPLRIIGCLAALVVVLGVAHVARRTSGDRAASWAALTAAALTISPMFGGAEVNGELLSAPIVVGGMAAAVHALSARPGREAFVASALAGSAMVAALLVKQNIADVGIFAGTAGLVALRRGEITRHRFAVLAGGLASGAVVVAGLVAIWTVSHGTSLTGVLYAMYPFRSAAGHVLATSTGSHASARFWAMLVGWVLSGAAIITIVAGVAVASGRMRGTLAWALLATVAFDSISVLMGGNYWRHYLVELVIPVALLAGILAARRQPGIRQVVTGTAIMSAFAWALVMPRAGAVTEGSLVGAAIHKVATPTDTIVTAYGHADVTETSGLSSPYPYLWSLPAKTLDPGQQLMGDVLAGSSAPTWVVVWNRIDSWGLDTTRTSKLLVERYHPVSRLDGHTIYLRNDVSRDPPHLALSGSDRATGTHVKEFTP